VPTPAFDRLTQAVAAAGPGLSALATVQAGDVASVLAAIPDDKRTARIDPDPAGGVFPFLPDDLRRGTAGLPPATVVHQLARQLDAALALVPA
jgi:hypothetical protein